MLGLVVILAVALAAMIAAYIQLRQKLSEAVREHKKWEERARHKAHKIVEEARDRAVEIVGEAKLDQGEVKQKLGEGLAEEYRLILEREAGASIEDYKQKRMQEIEARMPKLVEEVARKVIGRSLDMAQHRSLLLEALKEAKSEHVFEN